VTRRTRLAALLARLDSRWPARGPCGICGGPDARHRLWDAIETSIRVDGLAYVQRDWPGTTAADARLLRAAYDEARRRHVALPGRQR